METAVLTHFFFKVIGETQSVPNSSTVRVSIRVPIRDNGTSKKLSGRSKTGKNIKKGRKTSK